MCNFLLIWVQSEVQKFQVPLSSTGNTPRIDFLGVFFFSWVPLFSIWITWINKIITENWIILILNFNTSGAGFALSDASKVSGLSLWLGQRLTQLEVLPPFAIMLIICIMTASITEVASNTATANILLPILAEMVQLLTSNQNAQSIKAQLSYNITSWRHLLRTFAEIKS